MVVQQRPGEALPSDAELVSRARSGEREAFDLLAERYQQRGLTVAWRLLGNQQDALEICQEALIRAYRSLHTLSDANRFGAWLLRIVTNLSLNRRRSRRQALSLDQTNGGGEAVRDVIGSPQPGGRPGSELAARELAGDIAAALDELTDQQRAALVLFSIESLPQKEVAEILGCSVEGVKWHVFQARKRMKARLADWL